jgi:hypothetical protein
MMTEWTAPDCGHSWWLKQSPSGGYIIIMPVEETCPRCDQWIGKRIAREVLEDEGWRLVA